MTTSLKPEVIKKVEQARSFFDLAQVAAKSSHDLNLFVAINQVQDAVEIFLFALADHCRTRPNTPAAAASHSS